MGSITLIPDLELGLEVVCGEPVEVLGLRAQHLPGQPLQRFLQPRGQAQPDEQRPLSVAGHLEEGKVSKPRTRLSTVNPNALIIGIQIWMASSG